MESKPVIPNDSHPSHFASRFHVHRGDSTWKSRRRLRFTGSPLPELFGGFHSQGTHAHRIRMYAIYGDIYHQYTPVMLEYIPWILWDGYPIAGWFVGLFHGKSHLNGKNKTISSQRVNEHSYGKSMFLFI